MRLTDSIRNRCNKPSTSALHKACFQGDLQTVIKLHDESPANFKEQVDRDDTLILAVRNGHKNIVEKLLEYGANIEVAYGDNVNALAMACSIQDEEMVQLLLQHGAAIDVRLAVGHTLIHLAAISGNVNILKMLLLSPSGTKVSIDDIGRYGKTALHEATTEGHFEVVKFLVESGANIDREINHKKLGTALHLACENRHVDIAFYLLNKGANFKLRDENKRNALHIACEQGLNDIVIWLISHGADVNEKSLVNAPLHFACHIGSIEVVKYLLEKNAHTEERGNDNYTPLIIAAEGGHQEVVALLLQRGVDLGKKGNSGFNALHVACNNNQLEVAKLLLENGAKVNEPDERTRTPLHIASLRKHTDIVKCLISFGANIKLMDVYQATALHYACQSESLEIVKKLVEGGASTNCVTSRGISVLQSACGNETSQIFEYLINEGGADINQLPASCNMSRDKLLFLYQKGWKGAYIASHMDSYRCNPAIEELIKSGLTDLDLLDEKGATAIYYAFNCENYRIAKLLLEHGATVLSVDKTLRSPIITLATFSPRKRPREEDTVIKMEMAELLVKHGVDLNVEYYAQEYYSAPIYVSTALHVAIKSKFTQLVEFLIESGAEYRDMTIKENYKDDVVLSIWQLCERNDDFKEYATLLGGKWKPANHRNHPKYIRDAFKCFMLINNRQEHKLDTSTMHKIFEMIAYKWR